ncbi:MAG: L-rhamnose isomerase [Verrucomicrobia bacterium]|nr:L-rhamnose isomerase [Verrucomicrobiota bacterium]
MNAYTLAKETYASIGVDTEEVIDRLASIPISLHCWQGDDVCGFENTGTDLAGSGLAATGNYPGKARTIAELRADIEKALSLIPGKHRLNLHACYADLGGKKKERSDYGIAEFQSWIDWAKAQGLGMDFNPSFFAHPKASSGYTLSSPDQGIRDYWIEHGKACRRIGAEIGRQLGSACVTNTWIPDGSKDLPVDRNGPRQRLEASLDAVFAEKIDPTLNLDAVECKLFGIGSESYVVGSHEFYLGYAVTRQKLLCLDAGHFHPTEQIADKISSVLQFVPELLLHVSRGVRWDSDHVVLLDDPTIAIMEELVRGDFLARTHIGLDFFDASINRIAAWVIGTRSAQKALLHALLQPLGKLRAAENSGALWERLALMEESKTLPVGAVWQEFCHRQEVPSDWMPEVRSYERDVLFKRS